MRHSRSWRRPLPSGRSIRDEIEDEIAFHLETQTRALVAAGLSEEDARAEALRLFGNRERVERAMLGIDRARVRGERRGEMLKDVSQDLRFSFRYLRKRPGFTAVAICVLALGIGATMAVFSVVDAALLRPLPFPKGESVVRLSDLQREAGAVNASYPEVQDWLRELTFMEALAAFGTSAHILSRDGEPARVIGAHVVGDYLGVMRLAPVLGRGFSEAEREERARVVLLSEALWRQGFAARRNVLGEPLPLGEEVYTIIGVMPREANVLAAREDIALWLPFQPPTWATRGLHFMSVFGRMPSGMTLEEARARIEAVAQSLNEEGVTDHGIVVEGVRERLVAGSRPLLLALAGAVGFLLLIVCANLANLFLTQSTARGHEFAVRTALGAGRLRLTRQLVTEAVLVAVLGGVLGSAVGAAATGVVATAASHAAMLAPPRGIDVRVLLFGAAVTALMAIVVGAWPALGARGRELSGRLRESVDRSTAGSGARRSRRLLVGAEVALSLVLLAGAGLMMRSVLLLLDEDPGFRSENVLKFDLSLPTDRYDEARQAQLFAELLDRIRALPGVAGAAAINELPLGGGDVSGGFGIVGRDLPPEELPTVKKRVVTPGYFETLGIPVLRGRSIDETDLTGSREVVVISETLARRYWPGADPVGQRVRFGWGPGDEQEIVGVVGDVRHEGLDLVPEGMVYRPLTQFPFPAMTLVVRTGGDPLALVGPVRQQVRSLDPTLPIDAVASLDEVVRASLAARGTLMVLLTGFAALALVLAAVGVYAVTAQSVGRRTREIGVRKALGARDRDVLRQVVGEEAVVLSAGLVLGLVAAVLVTPVLASSLYRTDAREPIALAGAAALLAVVGLLATWLPARRAARVDPARALRSD